jgi:hypothetical protein
MLQLSAYLPWQQVDPELTVIDECDAPQPLLHEPSKAARSVTPLGSIESVHVYSFSKPR